jgi:hypothetical protein
MSEASSADEGSRFARTTWGPRVVATSTGDLQVSIHETRKAFQREIEFVLPGVALDKGLLAIATMQNARHDLVQVGDDIETEKDRLLETFMAFSKDLCERLIAKGHFADYIDPCSGLAMITKDANKVFSEVDSAQQLLGYSVMNAGCCKVLLHPSWGSAVYPATIFTNATTEEVVDALGVEA